MTTKDAFKLGYLSRLAERGITPSRFEKSAGIGQDVSSLLSTLSPLALAALVGVPAAGGVMTGWAHAGMTDVSPEDIDLMKKEEVADTYRSEARRIRRQLQRNSWRTATPKRPTSEF